MFNKVKINSAFRTFISRGAASGIVAALRLIHEQFLQVIFSYVHRKLDSFVLILRRILEVIIQMI